MQFTVDNIKEYARGLCDSARAAQIREYLVQNPDLIVHVLIEKRRMLMERLNISGSEIPELGLMYKANSLSATMRMGIVERLVQMFKSSDLSSLFASSMPVEIPGVGSIAASRYNSICAQARQLLAQASSARSQLSHMMSVLLAAVPDLTADQASAICRSLIKGASSFSDNFLRLQAASGQEADRKACDMLLDQIADLDREHQAACMLRFMAFVRSIDARNVGDALTADDVDLVEQFRTAMAEAEGQVVFDVTDDTLEQLREMLGRVVRNNSLALVPEPDMESIVRSVADGDIEALERYVDGKFTDVSTDAYTALVAYIAIQKKELPLPADIDPAMLASAIAAANARRGIVEGYSSGRITLERAKSLLKVAGIALLACVFAWSISKTMLLVVSGALLISICQAGLESRRTVSN